MGWKEYLAPSILRLVLAALLFSVIVPAITYDTGTACVNAPCPPTSAVGTPFAWFFLQSWPNHPASFFGLHQPVPAPAPILSIDIPLALAGILLCYLAVCILLFLLQKFTEKK